MTTSGEDAASRAKTARARADEIESRLRRLRSGEPVTMDDVSQAEQAADRQQERSAYAHRHAAEAHGEAAERHRQTADVLEDVGKTERAAEHRRRAELDDQAADADRSSAQADEED